MGVPERFVRTRFAPSLTGWLHPGHVLHLLFVWGAARRFGAKVVCRMEDHDRTRWRPEYEPAILEDLAWLGFVPDEGLCFGEAQHPSPYRQSDCDAAYEMRLAELAERGLVYGCACSRRAIAERTGYAGGELRYDGHCAERGLPLEGHTVRLRLPSAEVEFEDVRMGARRQTPVRQCGDFALRDRFGQWSYHFACVCDDVRQDVDLVVRGEDLLCATGRQILLFRLFGRVPPAWLHHLLLRDTGGKKLSKRQRSEGIGALRESGVSPEGVFGMALHAAGMIGEARPVSMEEALSCASGEAGDRTRV